MILKKLLLLLCLICCSNCSTKNLFCQRNNLLMADRDSLLMQGYTTNFVDGYMDGCRTGHFAAGDHVFKYTKDKSRTKSDHDYKTGWEQGNMFCYEHMKDFIKHNNNYLDPNYRQEAIIREKERLWSELKK